MSIKEQDALCLLCCGSLTLPMSKEEMEGLLKVFIDGKLTCIEFTQRNNNMTAIDRAKRIHELSWIFLIISAGFSQISVSVL